MQSMDCDTLRTGIVLRCIPARSRIVLFERTIGKYIGTCCSAISSGSCIVYQHSSRRFNSIVCIKILDVISVPINFARLHLIFLHKVIEICEASLPLESCDSDVFNLLMWVCMYKKPTISVYLQNLILAKLFMMLGLHSTRSALCVTCTALVHRASVDTLGTLSLDSKCNDVLENWLYNCLTEHLSAECLKTLTFFKKE